MRSPADPPGHTWRIGSAPRDGTLWMVAGSIVGGIGAYLFQIVGTRSLGERNYAPIAALWTIQYLTWSIVLHAVETHVDREIVTSRREGIRARRLRAHLWMWISGTAVLVTCAAWALRVWLFAGDGALAVVVGATVFAFGAFAIVRGRLAGEGRYRAYGLTSGSESTLRLVAAVWVSASIGTVTALAWTLPVGAGLAALGAWLVLLADPRRATPRSGDPVVGRGGGNPVGRFLAVTASANAAAQLMLAGGPLVLAALGASAAEISTFFVTSTAARVPVVIALSGGLSRALPAFIGAIETSGRGVMRSIAWRVGAGTIAAASVGALAGAVLGPPLIRTFFGDGFVPPWWLAAIVGGGVLLATGGMLLNHLAIAAGVERRLPVAWWSGVAVASVVVLAVPGSATARVAAGFAAGLATAFGSLVATLTSGIER